MKNKMKIEFEESKNIMRILKINGIYLIDYPPDDEQYVRVAVFYSTMKAGRYLMPEIISLVSGYIEDMQAYNAAWFSIITGYLLMAQSNIIFEKDNVIINNDILKIMLSSGISIASFCDKVKTKYFIISKNIEDANVASLIWYGMLIYLHSQSENINLLSFFN